jgi:hypothetical protein
MISKPYIGLPEWELTAEHSDKQRCLDTPASICFDTAVYQAGEAVSYCGMGSVEGRRETVGCVR